MNFIIDIILAALLAVCLIVGWKKGFVKSLMDLASNLIAFIVARVVSQQAAPAIYSNYFEQHARDTLTRELSSAGSSASAQVQSALDSIPESLDGFLGLLGLDKQALTESISQKLTDGAETVDVLMTNIVSPIFTAVIKLAAFVVVFIVAVLLLKLLTLLLDKLTELPAIKQANELFGLAFGAVKGVILIAVVCFTLELAAGFIGNESFSTLVENSKIIGVFDNILNVLNIRS